MNKRNSPTKLLMIGLDGLMMEVIEKFVSEDLMPNLAKLRDQGVSSKALSSMPVDTATNWTTIATGAETATHGKTSFFIHLLGRELDHFDMEESWLSNLCLAETLWDAAERQGKRAVVINYPVAWPATIKDGIVVGGRGVFGEPEMKIADIVQWSTKPSTHEKALRFEPAKERKGLLSSGKPILQARIAIGEGGEKLSWSGGGQEHLGQEETVQTSKCSHYDLALVASGEDGYDTLLFYIDGDVSNSLARLKVGQWTDWLYAEFGPDRQRGAFRYKLINISADASEVKLYRTPIVSMGGFAYPESLCAEVIDKLGPFIKGFDVLYDTNFLGDKKTAQDHIRMGVTQYIELTNYLAKTQPWDILITQIQFPDHLNHEYVRDIETSLPDHNSKKAELAWEQYRLGYAQADRYIGEIVREAADDQTLVVVLSDHAAYPMNRNCDNMEKAFIEAGLMTYKKNDKGHYVIDWSKTLVCPTFAAHYHVRVNLKGRDPQGIVEPGAEYERVRDRIIEALKGLCDEETGRHPIAVAMRKEDAAVLGQGGQRCGDVFFLFEPGYDTDPPNIDPTVDRRKIPVFGPYHSSHSGGHSGSLPTTKFEQSSLAAVFFAAGPGIKKRYRREQPIHLKDVAPTVCYLLGMAPPKESEGRVVNDFLS